MKEDNKVRKDLVIHYRGYDVLYNFEHCRWYCCDMNSYDITEIFKAIAITLRAKELNNTIVTSTTDGKPRQGKLAIPVRSGTLLEEKPVFVDVVYDDNKEEIEVEDPAFVYICKTNTEEMASRELALNKKISELEIEKEKLQEELFGLDLISVNRLFRDVTI